MPYTKFDPKGERPRERAVLKRERPGLFKTALQLIGIFTLLRAVMLATGITFIYIPVFDDIVVTIVRMFMPK